VSWLKHNTWLKARGCLRWPFFNPAQPLPGGAGGQAAVLHGGSPSAVAGGLRPAWLARLTTVTRPPPRANRMRSNGGRSLGAQAADTPKAARSSRRRRICRFAGGWSRQGPPGNAATYMVSWSFRGFGPGQGPRTSRAHRFLRLSICWRGSTLDSSAVVRVFIGNVVAAGRV
jgi:hypothetical protein